MVGLRSDMYMQDMMRFRFEAIVAGLILALSTAAFAYAEEQPVAVSAVTVRQSGSGANNGQGNLPAPPSKGVKEPTVTLQTETRMVTIAPLSAEMERFTESELRNIIQSKYARFAQDPFFIQRLMVINNDVVDFPTREFIMRGFDDEQKSFIAQRHKDLVLFLENYLVKNNLPNMTDVTEFVDKIEDKYFYFEGKSYGSSLSGDKNYYRTLLETQVTENEPAFNKFVRDFIKDAEIKRKKYFSSKVNDYFYENHFKEGVHYDKTLQDLVTNNLLEVFSADNAYSGKYYATAYEKFFADKSLLSATYNNALAVSVDAFRNRLSQSVIPTFVRLQAAGNRVLIREDYEQFSSQLLSAMTTSSFVFSNRNDSDTDLIGKLNASFAIDKGQNGSVITAKSCLQRYFAQSGKQVVQATIAAVRASLTQDNWDRAINVFIQTSETDPAIAETLRKTMMQEYFRQSKSKVAPFLVDLPAQLEGEGGPALVSALKEDIKALFDTWDVEAFRAPLQSDLLKEVFFPAKDLFVGTSPEAKARFQLLSFLTMYSMYYSGTPDASKRLETLLATPIKQHRQLVFEAPANRKLAVKEFRKMVRSNEGGIIAKATMNELVVATALAASIYTNPTNTPKAAMLILQSASLAVPPLAKLSSTGTTTTWKGLMSQIVTVFAQKGASSLIQSQLQPTPKPKTTTTSGPTPSTN